MLGSTHANALARHKQQQEAWAKAEVARAISRDKQGLRALQQTRGTFFPQQQRHHAPSSGRRHDGSQIARYESKSRLRARQIALKHHWSSHIFPDGSSKQQQRPKTSPGKLRVSASSSARRARTARVARVRAALRKTQQQEQEQQEQSATTKATLLRQNRVRVKSAVVHLRRQRQYERRKQERARIKSALPLSSSSSSSSSSASSGAVAASFFQRLESLQLPANASPEEVWNAHVQLAGRLVFAAKCKDLSMDLSQPSVQSMQDIFEQKFPAAVADGCVELPNAGLGAHAVHALCEFVQTCPRTKELKPVRRDHHRGLSISASVLRKLDHTDRLLQRELDDKQQPWIHTLNIRGNRVGDAGGFVLADFVAVNQGVTNLNISDTGMTAKGLSALLMSIAKFNRTLTSLDLRAQSRSGWMSLGAAGATALRVLLSQNTTIKRVLVAGTGIGVGDNLGPIRDLARGLELNTTLEYLDLSNCYLGYRAVSVLTGSLLKTVADSKLQALLLGHNEMDSAAAARVSELLRHLPASLTRLELARNRIGFAGFALLLDAMTNTDQRAAETRDCGISALNLSGNPVGDMHIDAVDEDAAAAVSAASHADQEIQAAAEQKKIATMELRDQLAWNTQQHKEMRKAVVAASPVVAARRRSLAPLAAEVAEAVAAATAVSNLSFPSSTDFSAGDSTADPGSPTATTTTTTPTEEETATASDFFANNKKQKKTSAARRYLASQLSARRLLSGQLPSSFIFNTTLTTLVLDKCKISDSFVVELVRVLQGRDVHGRSLLASTAVEQQTKSKKKPQTVEDLKEETEQNNNNNNEHAAAPTATNKNKKHTTAALTSLSMAHNDISQRGAAALASLLRSPRCNLVVLNLSFNYLRDPAAIDIAGALITHNHTLQSLDLSNNAVSERSGNVFLEALNTNPNLLTLRLEATDVAYHQLEKIDGICQQRHKVWNGGEVGRSVAQVEELSQIEKTRKDVHGEVHLLSLVHENAMEQYDSKVASYKSFKSNQKDQTENIFVKLDLLMSERRELEMYALDITNACHNQKSEHERQYSAKRAGVMQFVGQTNKLRQEQQDKHTELMRRTGRIYGFTQDDQNRAILKRLYKQHEDVRQEHMQVFKEAKQFLEHLEVFVAHNAKNMMLSKKALARKEKIKQKKRQEMEAQLLMAKQQQEQQEHQEKHAEVDEFMSLLLQRQNNTSKA